MYLPGDKAAENDIATIIHWSFLEAYSNCDLNPFPGLLGLPKENAAINQPTSVIAVFVQRSVARWRVESLPFTSIH